jgi:hypothetical protein
MACTMNTNINTGNVLWPCCEDREEEAVTFQTIPSIPSIDCGSIG